MIKAENRIKAENGEMVSTKRYGEILRSLHRRRVHTNYAVTRVGFMSWRVLSHFKGEHAVAGGCSHTSKENAHTPRAEAQL